MKAALAIVCLAVAACAAASPLAALVAERPIVLLGEVHDNTAQHAERLAALHALVERGARPALLFEQFERERQADIDRVRAASGDADALIAAGSARKAGWNWESYKPFVALALRHDLPIVAANVSRADARRIIDDGLAVHGFDAALPAGLLREQAAAVERGHCGLIDARAARRLALAQIARDQQMARLVAEHEEAGLRESAARDVRAPDHQFGGAIAAHGVEREDGRRAHGPGG